MQIDAISGHDRPAARRGISLLSRPRAERAENRPQRRVRRQDSARSDRTGHDVPAASTRTRKDAGDDHSLHRDRAKPQDRVAGAIGPTRPKCALAFEPTSNGTSVSFSGYSNPVGLLKPLSPLFNRKGQQVWTHRLDRIKSLLETPSGQSET